MTQEDKKQLLMKDLCARLPFNVKCYDFRYNDEGDKIDTILTLDCIYPSIMKYKYKETDAKHNIERIKPYLRSMSSMTEEEKDFIRNNYFFEDWDSWNDLLHLHYHEINIEEISEFMDWLYAHHFDFPRKINGKLTTLADLGLAIVAPKDMYKI